MPLLLLHGALGSHHQLTALAERCSTWTDVHILEFMGHGQSPDIDEAWTVKVFARQLEDYLAANGPHSVFGYSMGGYVSLDVLSRGNENITSLVTLGTKLAWSPESAAREVKMLDAEKIEAKVPAFAADLSNRHGEHRWKHVLERTAHLMLALGSAPLTLGDMHKITCPVQLMVGDRDEMVSIEETREFQKEIPGSRLAVLPGTKHPIDKVDLGMLDWHLRRAL